MINKRLLIKHLLAHNDENSFYDKKRKISLGSKEGKAKFLKHICALSNSNPENNSYIVIGVEDEDNSISGVDFYDDAKIQNLVNAYLSNAPIVAYENIPFPHLPDDKVVGLVTIRPNKGKICSLRKNIWKYYGGSVFFRDGSISMPKVYDLKIEDKNSEIVKAIEDHAQNNVELTLDGVFDFLNKRKDFNPKYKVFKEYFVVCWAGKKKTVKENVYYSRVDIALINEQVKLFYSELDEVSFSITEDEFQIIEYVYLGLQHQKKYYPLEEVSIKFKDNVSYDIETKLLFKPPQYDKKTLYHIYNSANTLLEKLKNKAPLTTAEKLDVFQLPQTYLICYFNEFEDALIKLESAKYHLKSYDTDAYSNFKDSVRILRKVKYN
ncbi:ATP-binding protein [Croceibacter atlanticus]|uniref:Succinate dehydrogenase n=2 Tax=Croceibacter TaxID=216431 RepID=A3U709_CROAH|nr:ATP-binding protein [Croceibacter atlanticus]MAM23669.1 ATP-binding protein [Croceibacter sp.]HAT69260.1 ATP-binding protein [Flavobacteriaceae bacterium]EAP88026.1 succinate dehydrogenase [Croceibacter atlanticus HTCC2559]MBW4969767.1 ATP-binding protein [Croceibacter atlanticus]WSP35665.1 ATP-binding protein [Croceibacter atlanticus]